MKTKRNWRRLLVSWQMIKLALLVGLLQSTAVCAAGRYTVTWKNEDGSVLETDFVAYGTVPSYDGATPTKTGTAEYAYTFYGWSPAIAAVTEDVTYTATYKRMTPITVTWKNHDGSVLETDYVAYGTVPSYDGATPTKAADERYMYKFGGWKDLEYLTNRRNHTLTLAGVTRDMTYIATYTAMTKTDAAVADGMEIGERDANAGLLHVAVMADPHSIYELENQQSPNLGDAIIDAKSRGAQKILMAGDYTFWGVANQYDLYTTTVGTYAGDTEVIEAIGNHELYAGRNYIYDSSLLHSQSQLWRDKMGTGVYFSQWIGNTRVVALGNDIAVPRADGTYPEGNANISSTQLDWVERIVEEDDENGVTTIILCHWTTNKINSGYWTDWEDQNNMQRLYNIVASHSNAVLFTGHSHHNRIDEVFPTPTGGLIMHAGRIFIGDDPSRGPFYVMMDELPSEFGVRKYQLSYILVGAEEPLRTVMFEHSNVKHKITWTNYDGSILKTGTEPFGTTPSYSGIMPTRPATGQYTYTFYGWSPRIATVTSDATYAATYKRTTNQYTVEFVNEDGTELQSSEIAYGTMPSYSGETPIKAADAQYTYTFAGWTPEVGSVTGDATYTATYTAAPIGQPEPETYTVTWKNYDGTVLETDENVESGTMPSYNGETPIKAADAQYMYTFAGWTPEVGSVTGDAVYTAVYTGTLIKSPNTHSASSGGRVSKPAIEPDAPSGEDPDNIDSSGFTDLISGEWYIAGVDYVLKNDIMNGYPNGEFRPDGNCSRSMFVTMLYRLEGEPAAAKRADYLDVQNDAWYSDAVAWATANDVVNGVGGNCFDPDGNITREQLAAILYRYARSKGYDVTVFAPLSGFADANDVSGYALDAMRWAHGSGLITGVTPTALEPQGMATRAQVATVLMRFCENVVK